MPPIFSLDLKKGLVGVLELLNGQRNVLSDGSSIDGHMETKQESALFSRST